LPGKAVSSQLVAGIRSRLAGALLPKVRVPPRRDPNRGTKASPLSKLAEEEDSTTRSRLSPKRSAVCTLANIPPLAGPGEYKDGSLCGPVGAFKVTACSTSGGQWTRTASLPDCCSEAQCSVAVRLPCENDRSRHPRNASPATKKGRQRSSAATQT
jgi:hypothetical protein